ncbi:hypothetical protein SAMN02910298_01078 [Pseudobutyrivibrio sp. YE44]|uniref:PF20097 family protein n=1 Tax=Pseudobutyrivibrio sp. YE44 TaxID=1520802 RepID=UPI00088774E1|nr:PF20097 family protein [Pseudobutyrivibrio sp. YE44]SDB22378.1 hypothetical protein SAMN02910298_01078 [Pseudobutyrivibrio sp. YE44]
MNCPNCGKEMRPGVVESVRALNVIWYPKNYKHKSIDEEKPVSLSLKAEGYYCDECNTAFASYKKREHGFLGRLVYKIFDEEY